LLGGGRTTSREDLQISYCSEDSFSGEIQQRFKVLWESFSISASIWQSTLLKWSWKLVRRAHLHHSDLCFILIQVSIVSGSYVYCTFCIPPSFLHMHTLIFQTCFPRGGFIQGHVDQEYMFSFSCMLVFRTTLFQL
jgi:hypothetical protein